MSPFYLTDSYLVIFWCNNHQEKKKSQHISHSDEKTKNKIHGYFLPLSDGRAIISCLIIIAFMLSLFYEQSPYRGSQGIDVLLLVVHKRENRLTWLEEVDFPKDGRENRPQDFRQNKTPSHSPARPVSRRALAWTSASQVRCIARLFGSLFQDLHLWLWEGECLVDLFLQASRLDIASKIILLVSVFEYGLILLFCIM